MFVGTIYSTMVQFKGVVLETLQLVTETRGCTHCIELKESRMVNSCQVNGQG